MAEEKQKSAETAQALGEEELDKVVGAIQSFDGGPEAGKEAWNDVKDMFQRFRRGLGGEGVQSRENREKLGDVLKGKAKW